MRFKNTFWNRFFLARFACCSLFFLVFCPFLDTVDALLRPWQRPDLIPVAIVLKITLVYLYFLTAAMTCSLLFRKFFSEEQEERKEGANEE